MIENTFNSTNTSQEIEILEGKKYIANYPDQIYLTILGDLTWFRGDFNISYRFINLPGPDGGNITSIKILPPPPTKVKSQTLTITLIIAISSVLIVLMLTIIVFTCIVMKKRK